jgi:predicted RNA-binding protein
MNFTFFMTFVPQLNLTVPIVMGYEKCTPKNIELIKAYEGLQFIHSGNWWNIDPKKRTLEIVLENQEKFYVPGKTVGFMSLNTPASLTNYEYWNIPEAERRKAIQQCLENATWALQHRKVKTPIYCSLEVSTIDETQYWFRKARDEGHECFCRGVAEFLGNPKLRKKGTQTVFEITVIARKVLEDSPFHVSGLSSLYLLPIIAYLGATSVDGSTPVTSALGRGTVYTPDGKGLQCRNLTEWECSCEFCRNFKGDIIKEFNDNRLARVHHNVALWQEKVKNINGCQDKGELKQLIENEVSRTQSKYYQKLWNQALELESDLLK